MILNRKIGWEQVRQEITGPFLSKVKEGLKESLYAVILYGSAARGKYKPGISDINLLILYEKANPEQLFQLGKLTASWIQKWAITPLLMSREEFLQSADVFPLEYIDIRNAHEMLFGPDITLSLDLNVRNLRHQAEEKLRGSLNQLRQLLIASAGKLKLLSQFLRSWSSASNALFRSLLILKGEDPNISDPDLLVQKVGSSYKVPTNGFIAFERFRRGEKVDPLSLTKELIHSLEELTKAVDALEEQ
ncbi:MAG: nucleotidyltransferase domain-containing protein [Spirochaetales bacterium]